MATLYLHIGHGKTGTSWIQACLRLNRVSLAIKSIIYAIGEDHLIDEPYIITSGNASNLFESKTAFEENLAINANVIGKDLLYSSEHIPNCFINSNAEDYLEEIAAMHGFDKIKILLFIRNPISLAVSMWQQRTKRRGNHIVTLSNLHEHPDIGWDIIFNVEDLMNRLRKCKNVTLTIRNYSNCSDKLIDEIADWLEVPIEILNIPSIKRVNRTPTWSELVFQKSLNKILGRSGYLFSDPLCERLTDIETEKVLPPINVQKAIWSILSKTIERINEQIPEQQRYQCDILNSEPLSEVLTFNLQQIEIISESVGNEILGLRLQLENAQKTIFELKNENTILKIGLTKSLEKKNTLTLYPYIIKRIKNKILISIKQILR
jgi:hypothetical protein